MQGFDLSTVSGIYMGADSIYGLYIGSTLIWPINYENEYLTITSMADPKPGYDNYVTFNQYGLNPKTIETSYDKETWTQYTSTYGSTTFIGRLRKGQKLYIRGYNSSYANSESSYCCFDCPSGIISGNIMSLIDGDNFTNLTTLTEPYAFAHLFDTSRIIDASNLILPATTLSSNCYSGMFMMSQIKNPPRILPATTLAERCYYNMFASADIEKAPMMPATTMAPYCYMNMFQSCNFTIAPALPATTLAEGCYFGMFLSCIHLTTPPQLSATTLAPYCYRDMFNKCLDLQNTPTLPATTMVTGCYYGMFYQCISLITAPALPATTLADNCYNAMFKECRYLRNAPELPATTLAPYCYCEMFRECTYLTYAPVLPAPILANRCYARMFYSCTNLCVITLLTTDAQVYDKYALSDWVYNVAHYGTFTKYSYELIIEDSDSGIPEGWLIYYADSNVYSVSIGTVTNGTVTSDKQTANAGETVTLTVTPNTGYELEILNVIDGNGNRITVTNNQFEMPNSNVTITASFAYYEDMYFTIESEVDNNVIGWKNDSNSYKQRMYFSTDLVNWNSWESTETGIILKNLNAGDRLYLKANLSYSTNYHSYFVSGGNFKVYGNSMSLIYGDNFANQTSVSNYALQNLFENCTYLTDASNLILPATTLASYCYYDMFSGCTSLTTAPALPATTLANLCYEGMFTGCTSLTTAPALTATTLAEECYAGMFMGCTSLTTPPSLPATTLATRCYKAMFYGCTSLARAPLLPATTLVNYCYQYMFQGCTSLAIAPSLPATTLVNYCYQQMFKDCTALRLMEMLATNISASNCLNNWVENVAATGTFRKADYATLPIGKHGIPSGWNVINVYGSLYLTIESQSASNTITWKTNNASYTQNIQYSTNLVDWATVTSSSSGATISTLDAGDKIYLKGSIQGFNNYNYYNYIDSTGNFKVYGNIMSVTDGDNFDSASSFTEDYQLLRLFSGSGVTDASNLILPLTTLRKDCYRALFQDCTSLATAPVLPATTLAMECYRDMFKGCTSLTSAPKLPATTLAEGCYRAMFSGCSSLATAPVLLATTLGTYCYYFMFENCTSLAIAPSLPATTLANYCYYAMFNGCTSLTTSPELPATTLVSNCYGRLFDGCSNLNYIKCLATSLYSNATSNWVRNVSSSGTFVKASSMTSWTTGTGGIPSGWTIQNA